MQSPERCDRFCAAASILYYKGLVVRGQGRWPAVDAWFDAMETRDTYLGIKSDIYTHVFDLPPQIGGAHWWLALWREYNLLQQRVSVMVLDQTSHVQPLHVVRAGRVQTSIIPITLHLCAGCVSIPEAEEAAAALDGSDDHSWHLPLSPLSSTSLECHAPGEHISMSQI